MCYMSPGCSVLKRKPDPTVFQCLAHFTTSKPSTSSITVCAMPPLTEIHIILYRVKCMLHRIVTVANVAILQTMLLCQYIVRFLAGPLFCNNCWHSSCLGSAKLGVWGPAGEQSWRFLCIPRSSRVQGGCGTSWLVELYVSFHRRRMDQRLTPFSTCRATERVATF